jgi:hypothetical protein
MSLNSARKTHANIYLFGLCAAASVVFDSALPASIGLVFSSVVFSVVSIHLAMDEARRSALTLTPIVCYQLWQVVTLGAAPIYTVAAYHQGDAIPFANYDLSMDQIAKGHALLVVGAWAFYSGMALFRPRERNASDLRVAVPSVLSLGMCFGVGVLLSYFRDSVTSYAGSMVAQLSLLPVGVLCLLALNPPPALRRRHGMQLSLVALGTLVLILLALPRGAKMELMFAFFPLIWSLVQQRRWKSLFGTGICLGALYLLVVAPFVTSARNLGRNADERSRLNSAELGATLWYQLQASFRSDSTGYLVEWLDETMSRVNDSTAAGMVRILADDEGFLNGEGLDYLPMAFVPRVFWPEKPTLDQGRWFAYKLGVASDPSTATTSIGQTAAGELYWNFGWLGVIFGMFIAGGSLAGCMWRIAGPAPEIGILEMTAYTTAMLTFLLGTNSTAGSFFVGNISLGLMFFVLMKVRKRFSGRRRIFARPSESGSRTLRPFGTNATKLDAEIGGQLF